jgi:hypothetical protein
LKAVRDHGSDPDFDPDCDPDRGPNPMSWSVVCIFQL